MAPRKSHIISSSPDGICPVGNRAGEDWPASGRRQNSPARPRRQGDDCRSARISPFVRHTLSGRRTTASGRSPGSRVDAFRPPSRNLWFQWRDGWIARRLQLQGQRGRSTRLPFSSPHGEPVALALIRLHSPDRKVVKGQSSHVRTCARFAMVTLLFTRPNCYHRTQRGRGTMAILTRWMDWFCQLFACTAENEMRVNGLIAHVSSDSDDR
jgi:hypothetical protein